MPLVPKTLHPIFMNFSMYTGKRQGPSYKDERGTYKMESLLRLLCQLVHQYILI